MPNPEAPAVVGLWLFDGSVETLPGGYDKGELSPNSPVRELQSFVTFGYSLESSPGRPGKVLADPLRNNGSSGGCVRFKQVRHG